jgi:phage regulator Rha-like protein
VLAQVDPNVASMTSEEIAEMVGSRHDSVVRTIERLAERLVIQPPPMVEVKNLLGQRVGQYVFSGEKGKRDSIIVVAQLCPEFTAAQLTVVGREEKILYSIKNCNSEKQITGHAKFTNFISTSI